jgi:anti-sigma B factor antagonist
MPHILKQKQVVEIVISEAGVLPGSINTYLGRKINMEITTKQLKRVDLVTVSGRIDSATAPELDSVLKSIVEAGRYRICVDLKDLEYMSSAGIKVLISTLKTCKRWNRGDLRLANMPPRISDVFDLAGLTPLFKIYPDAVEAVGSF